jgi:hypothetical protein
VGYKQSVDSWWVTNRVLIHEQYYKITPYSRALIEKFTATQLVQKNSHYLWTTNVHYLPPNSLPIDEVIYEHNSTITGSPCVASLLLRRAFFLGCFPFEIKVI